MSFKIVLSTSSGSFSACNRLNSRKEMFYLRLYGIRHMVKDHSDNERKPADATRATLSDYQQGFFYMHHPTDKITHTTAFVIPVVEH